MKYSSAITQIGKDALIFLEDTDTNFVILFNDNAPEELAEISVLHTQSDLNDDVKIGDTLSICNKQFKISAIGDEALKTLKELGHCTLGFKGGDNPERPGFIMLEGEALTPKDIVVGGKIEIN